MKRIASVATVTFLEGIRSRALYGIFLIAIFILILNVTISDFFMRDIGKVTVDMNLSAISFSGILLLFSIGLNLISKDMDKKTVHIVLSKPISRTDYVLGKYIGIILFVATSLLLIFILSCLTIFYLRSINIGYFEEFAWISFFVASGFIFLKIFVLSAIVMLFSTITTSSFVTLIFSVSAYIIGETIEEVVFYLKSSADFGEMVVSSSLVKIIQVVSYVFPNLSFFDFGLEAAHGLAIDPQRILSAFGYGFFYVLILLFTASFVFRRRDFN